MATVVIASTVLPNWHYSGTTFTLRLFSDRSWVALDGTVVPGRGDSDTFYKEYTVSVAGTDATIPQVTLLSQTDAPSEKNARYSAVFYVDGAEADAYLPNTLGAFQVPDTPASTTWKDLEQYNFGVNRRSYKDDGTYSALTIDQKIAAVSASTTLATSTVAALPTAGTAGRLRLATTVDEGIYADTGTRWYSATNGVYNAQRFGAVGDGTTNDTAIFTSILTNIGSAEATLLLPPGQYLLSTITFPANVKLVSTGGSIKVVTGQTVTINGALTLPPRQFFYNALSGQGTIVFSDNVQQVFPEWWKTHATPGTTDMTEAIQAAITALPRGGVVQLQTTTYLTGQLNITADGTTIQGCGSHIANGPKPTTLLYTGLANNSSGIVNAGKYGMTLRNFYMEMITGSGGAGIKVTAAGQALIDGVDITNSRGTSFIGIQLGDRASGADAVIVSTIRGCQVGGPADVAFLAGQGSTSIHFQNCYALGTTNNGFEFYQSVYSDATACATDSGSGWGYFTNGARSITLTNCGAEAHGKGYVHLEATSSSITVINGFGKSNNTSADTAIGSFLYVMGSNYGVTVVGGSDETPNAATTDSIKGTTGALGTVILGYNDTAFPKGYGGDATWLKYFLCILGGADNFIGQLTVGTVGGSGGLFTLTPKTNDAWASSLILNVDSSNHVIAASNTTSATSTYSTTGTGLAGQWLYIDTAADSSGSVVVTFGGSLHSSGTQTTAASRYSAIAFKSNGSVWTEQYRTTNVA